MRGLDRTQALSRAVLLALHTDCIHELSSIVLWICDRDFLKTFLTLSSHRDINIIKDVRHLLIDYLTQNRDSSISLRTFSWSWSGCRSTCKHDHLELLTLHPLTPLSQESLTPKQAMWNAYTTNYTPSNHLAHIACTTPYDATLPPATLAAAAHENCLVSSTIVRITTGHCFDADYSDRFRPGANNLTTCPCAIEDHPPPTPTREGPLTHHTRRHTHCRHTCHHIIF